MIGKNVDLISCLPQEIAIEIFHWLQPSDLAKCRRVCLQWQTSTTHSSLQTPETAFGQREWKRYFGFYVEEPSLPADIRKELESQCPFSDDKEEVEKTQLLVLIPTITLRDLGQLFKSKFPELGNSTGYEHIHKALIDYGNNAKPHWVLLTKKTFRDTVGNKNFSTESQLIFERGQGHYQVPPVVDLVASMMAEYARSKTVFLSASYCKELYLKNHLYVSFIPSKGFKIHYGYSATTRVAAMKNL